ncbi:MAG TPA: immunoglobulin domain-containing protein [Verrucomicrobiota bacterium]|nr:immunoglobulin domain-containing protein [Verrucomicrobiota bacterium]
MKRILTSLATLLFVAFAANAADSVYINEVLPNPPGTDTGNEYFELRGTPNMSLAGYYLLSLEGQGTTGRGDINQYFDLGSFSLGANGYLFARQAGSKYTATDPGATVIENAIGTGWGQANVGGSSVGHYSDASQVDLENSATTFLLINIGSGVTPSLANDLDTNNDGLLDLPAGWTVVDSVGIMDGASAAATDFSYGAITFRAPLYNTTTYQGTCAYGNIIDVPPPSYSTTAGSFHVGRKGESTGSTSNYWAGSIVEGNAASPLAMYFFGSSDPFYTGIPVSAMVYGGTNPSPAPLDELAYTPTINGTRFTNYTHLRIGGPIGDMAVDPQDNTTILFAVDSAVSGGIYRACKVASGNWQVDSTPVVSGLSNPSGLVVETNGTLWWVHLSTMSLMRLRAPWSANTPELVITNFGSAVTDDDPIDLTFAPASFTGPPGQPGWIVVADRGSDDNAFNALNLLDPATTQLYQTNNNFLVAPTGSGLGGGDVNAIGSLPQSGEVVTLSWDGYITAVNGSGTTRTITPTTVSVTAGMALAVDPTTGRVWVADDALDEVWSVDPSASSQTADAKELSFPLLNPSVTYRQMKFHDPGMAFAANGEFLVVSDTSTAGGGGRLLIFHNEPFSPVFPPSITANPTNQSVPQGQTAVFSVTVSGTEPFAYQWFKNETNLISGATTAVLSLSNVQSGDVGGYSVLVTNFAGSTNSSVATLTLLLPPSITASPTNQSVPRGQTAVFSVTVSGTEPFAYQWFKNETNLIVGATAAELSLSNVQSEDVGGYFVLVTNAYGATNSSVATLTLLLPPSITASPTNQSVPQGQTAVFSVMVSGTEPFAYQWFKNETNPIAGATAAELSLSNVQSEDVGGYSVLVTNAYGATNSSVATLTLLLPPSITANPTNQSVRQGQTAVFSVTVSGTEPFAYQWFKNETNLIAGATAAELSLSNVQSEDVGGYSVLVTNVAGSTKSSVATLTLLLPPSITANPTNQSVRQGQTAVFSVTVSGTEPFAYQWFKNETNLIAGATAAELSLSNVQSEDVGGYSVLVTNAYGATNSSVATLTLLLPPSITANPTNQSVRQGQTTVFSVTVSGTEPFAYQWFKNETNLIAGATAAELSLSNVQTNDAGGYSVLVTNAYGATNSSVATLVVLLPPVIVQHPQSRAAVIGGSAQFTVSAAGNTNRTYQWQHAGTNLIGHTNSVLTLINLQAPDFGEYRVVVSNPDGSTPSNPAQLTQAVRPQLTPPEINLNTVYLSFPTEIGPVYEVEYKIVLEDPVWQELTALSGTGGTLSVTDNNVTNTSRFYRVRMR